MITLGTPPFVCLITKGEATPENYFSERARILETLRDAAGDGVSMIQIREKQLPARLLFDLVSEAVKVRIGTPARIFVNERADVALAAGADGVHLPEDSLSPDVIRKSVTAELIVGRSVHSIESAKKAADAGADYIFFAPVFETPGKGAPVGVQELKRVCDTLTGFPVIALGGIDESNFVEALDAGASGIAAIRSLHERASRRRIIDRVR